MPAHTRSSGRPWRDVVGRMALLTLALVACERPAPPPARPLVVASVYPVWEFSRQVAGDRAEVVALVPPGVEPHDWEPAPKDVAQVQRARMFVYNGAGFEQSADRLLQAIAGTQVVAVDATAGLRLIVTSPGTDSHGGHRHGASAATVDPHVWLDPVLAQSQVSTIRAAFERADPVNATVYADNARAFTARLAALHEAFEAGLRDCVRRSLVVSHAAFTYLARRYDLRQIAVTGRQPESEPSPADLATIVRAARREGARYVFFETLVSPRLAETLAREIGAQTLVLNPVEGLTREEAAAGRDYLTLMRQNLEHLRIGLQCR
jgi:zinc transport system substrate-binding protein